MDTNGVVGAMVIDSDGLCLACKKKLIVFPFLHVLLLS